MLGTIINALAIIVGSLVGVLTRGGIPERFQQTIVQALGLSVILIGLNSALKTNELLLLILSMPIGAVIGEILKIEKGMNAVGGWLEKRFSRFGEGISKAFVTAALIYCTGSMAIVGSIESGLTGNHQTLFAKSILDGVISVVFASSLGIGVIFSAVAVFIYQGVITIAASSVSHLLTPVVITEMSAVGGLLVAGIGFNLLEIKKINVANMIPAVFVPLVYFTALQFLK